MTAQAWVRGAVIYQIYPRSFSDGNGDGVVRAAPSNFNSASPTAAPRLANGSD